MAKRRKPPTMDAKFRIPVDEVSRRLCGRSVAARPHRDVGSAYLEAVANRLLAKAGFFPPVEQPALSLAETVANAILGNSDPNHEPIDANAIGQGGHLRPTWTGRA